MNSILLKTLLLVSFGCAFLQVSAQKKMEKTATFYAEEAASTFDLDEQTKEKVYTLKLEQIKETRDLKKRKEAGEFADNEAFKAARKEVMKPLDKEMMELLGVKGEPYWEFNKSVKQKMKEQKEE